MNSIDVKNISKQFGTFKAVDSISFSLQQGEILGLLGPNGAGKTTTIQMLLGILTPTSGSVEYFGKNLWTHREEILERVNFSSTYTNLPWNLSVKENLTYISYLFNIPNRKKKLEEVVSIFKLKDLLENTMGELSAGQLTRVNLAKAFINSPTVLLLDEPTASLDPEIAHYIRDYLLEKQQNEHISIIFTSHNMSEVEMLCDRVLFINSGAIVANGTPEDLAKSLDFSRIHFAINKGSKEEFKQYCIKNKIEMKQEGIYSTIQVKEKEVAHVLEQYVKQGIRFDEISIDKPTLEDYFLLNTKQKTTSFEQVT